MKLKITIFDLIEINKLLVSKYGGAGIGFNNEGLAISSIEGCEQEVFGLKLYPTIEDKIAHLVFSIIKNHIFIDGNKRTGIFVLNILLTEYKIHIENLDAKQLAIKIATSEINEKDLANILKNRKMV